VSERAFAAWTDNPTAPTLKVRNESLANRLTEFDFNQTRIIRQYNDYAQHFGAYSGATDKHHGR
jgi:hypothetical protein